MPVKRKQLRPNHEPMRMLTPRVKKSQAEALVAEADRIGVSLNALYVYRLTCPLDPAGFEEFIKEHERVKAPGRRSAKPADLQAPPKCARVMCLRPHDGCRHTIDTQRLYCWDCARKINDHHPDSAGGSITIPDTARQSYLEHIRAGVTLPYQD